MREGDGGLGCCLRLFVGESLDCRMVVGSVGRRIGVNLNKIVREEKE